MSCLLRGHPASCMRVVLLRHGESAANALGSGTPEARSLPDPPLTDKGASQAASWAEPIAAGRGVWAGLQRVYVSPLLRTAQTAGHAFERSTAPLLLAAEAREHWWRDACNRGAGELGEQLPARWLQRIERWDSLAPSRIWGGEAGLSNRELNRRAQECTDALVRLLCEAAAELEAKADPLVAVVTHWGVIARLTDCEVLNCTAVFMEWSRADGTAEGGPRLGRSPQVD